MANGAPAVTQLKDGGVEIDFGGETKDVVDETTVVETFNMVGVIKKKRSEFYRSYHNPANKLSGEDFLKELGELAVDQYDEDEASRTQWLSNMTAANKIFTSIMDKKSTPWEDASNINLPILATSALQFQARAVEALVPSKGIVQTQAVGPEDELPARRVMKAMNHQLYNEMGDFEYGMDKSLLQLSLEGSIFRKTFFDERVGQIRSNYVSANDFVINYGAESLEDAERYTHVLHFSRSDIIWRALNGVYDEEVALEVANTAADTEAKSELKLETDRSQGIMDNQDDLRIPRKILEQHRGLDLDGDGIDEPYVVTLDYDTSKVLRITPRRYTNELGEEINIDYFTHYEFFPNPEGFYALGFGTLLLGLNAASNSILNQVVDSGTLSILQGGFISTRSTIRKGQLQFKMGEFKEFDGYTDDIRKSIFTMDFKGPDATMFQVLGLLFDMARQVASISETMTGQLPASDTPATTVLALIEEGRKVFSTIHKRIHRAFKKELSKIYRLNGIFMDEAQYVAFFGESELAQGASISDFQQPRDVIPVSDPTITSIAEKIIKAEQRRQIILTDPLSGQNQQSIYLATRALLELLDTKELDQLYPPPGPPPDISPHEENAGIITEKPAQALPEQNHEHHLEIHESLLVDFGDNLTPAATKLTEQHIREHLGLGYLVAQQGGQNAPTQ